MFKILLIARRFLNFDGRLRIERVITRPKPRIKLRRGKRVKVKRGFKVNHHTAIQVKRRG